MTSDKPYVRLSAWIGVNSRKRYREDHPVSSLVFMRVLGWCYQQGAKR